MPVRWFVLFADEEREFAKPERVRRADSSSCSATARPMVQARRRLARGLKVLREELEEGPLVDGLVDVGRWLEEFHPRSLVELDYGGLVHAIPEEQLAGDHSAADVAEGLAALREGDGERGRRGVRAADGSLAGGAGTAVRQLTSSRVGAQIPATRSCRGQGLRLVPADRRSLSWASVKRDGEHLTGLLPHTIPRVKIGQGVRRAPSVELWADRSVLPSLVGLMTPDPACD